jgi:hypothetical protein
LISWGENIKKTKKEIIENISDTENQINAQVECNNDLNNYYFDFNYEWTEFSLEDDERFNLMKHLF